MKQFVQYFEEHFGRRFRQFFCMIMLCTLCCTAFFGCSSKEAEVVVSLAEQSETDQDAEPQKTVSEPKETEKQTDSPEQEKMEEIYVYVCGCVKNPAVYQLPAGSRICDLVEMAGGMTEEAADDYWNLAELLNDGDMIYVPTKEEAADRDPLQQSEKPDVTSDGKSTANGLVNINTADSKELVTLPGIGEARAAMIIAYRNEHGSFATISDLKNVSGIGDALFDNLKTLITVD